MADFRKFLNTISLLALLLFVFIPFGQAIAAEQITLQLKWRHQFQFAGYYAAIAKGYYKDAGLEVTLREVEEKHSPLEVMLAGDAEYAITASEILIQRASGQPVVALGSIFQHSPYAFLVRGDTDIHRIEDLAGHRIMLAGGFRDAALLASLKRAGLSIGTYTLQPTSYNPESLINNETDAFNAYITDQGFYLQERGIEPRYLLPKQYGIDFYGDVLATTEQEIEQHPDRVMRFLDASIKGWTYALNHPDEIIDLILERYNTQNFSREHLAYEARTTRELVQPILVPIGYMNTERWKHIYTIFEELGFIAKGSDYSGLIYAEHTTVFNLTAWLKKNTLLVTTITISGFSILLILTSIQLKRILNLRTGELQRSETRYRTIFNAAPEGMWLIDPEKQTIEVNGRLTKLLGYSREEMLGKTPMEFVDDQNRKIFIEQTSHIATTDRRSYEIALRHKQGYNIPTLFSAVTLRNNDESVMAALAFITDISEQLALLEEIRRQKDYLDHLAHHDPLTNLPNRILFMDRLEQSIHKTHRAQKQLAIFFIDVDRFKEINDSLGHQFGDLVLQEITKRFSGCIREDDTLARLGGDEFTLIMESIEEIRHTAILAQKLIDSLHHPMTIDQHQLFITASMGISIYPNDGKSAEVLLKNADAAMYKAKRNARNSFQYYTSDMTEVAYQRVSMDSALRQALDNQEFILHYQPQFDLNTGRITGVEALVRWMRPVVGLVSPLDFIPIAEDNGLIIPLGEWILEAACQQIVKWRAQGLAPGTMSINISSKQLNHPGLIDAIKSALGKTGCRPEWLELEITESYLMEFTERHPISQLQQFRDLGIGLAIDDFGTGYSSLSYLKRLPINKLKVDKSFVLDIPEDSNDIAITKAVIALGKSLGLTVIAEGIETETQRQFLQAEGCDLGQGFYYSRPINDKELTTLLSSGIAAKSAPTQNSNTT